MSLLIRFRAWFQDFERCVADDQWQRLSPYLDPGVEYRVSNVPFGGVVRGRQAVLDGFRRSFDGFDRRMASREHLCVGTRIAGPDRLEFRTWTRYTHAGTEPLAFPARSEFRYREGLILSMEDLYEPELAETAAAFAWFAAHAERLQLDPRYA